MTITTIIPEPLCLGDKILLFAASSRVAAHRVAKAVTMYQELGYEVDLQPDLEHSGSDYFAATTAICVDTIHRGFADPTIKALIAIRGGYGAMRLLPHLDYALIAKQPKILIGYSDVTALLLAINQRTGLCTYHGPMGVTPMTRLTAKYWRELLCDNRAPVWEPLFDVNARLSPPTTLYPGQAQGILVGGNLSLCCSLLASPYVPSDWSDKILFLEDTGEDVYRLDRYMAQLELAGVLGKIKGLVLGSFAPYTTKLTGSCTLESMFQNYAERYQIPCYIGALFGHQDDMITLPIGRRAGLDAANCKLQLLG